MAFVIALAGKGGTGKTSIAALTVKYLMEKKNKAVLAVDADSNSCLNEALGVDGSFGGGGDRADFYDLAVGDGDVGGFRGPSRRAARSRLAGRPSAAMNVGDALSDSLRSKCAPCASTSWRAAMSRS